VNHDHLACVRCVYIFIKKFTNSDYKE